METPPLPPDEAARLAALEDLRVLDTPPDPGLDRLVRLASRLLDMPIALISLVDRDRQWFKARVGLAAGETPRDISFCGHAVAADEGMEVPDALMDPRFADNPLVTGDPHIRFYAGEILRGPDGHALGTLCVIDTKPRRLSGEHRVLLRDLADLAGQELWFETTRHLRSALAEREAQLSFLSEHSSDLLARHDPTGRFLFVTPSLRSLLGYEPEEVLGRFPTEFLAPEDVPGLNEAFLALLRNEAVPPFRFQVRHKEGGYIWLESKGTVILASAGGVKEVVISSRDISSRVEAEQALAAREAFYRHMIENLDEGVVLQGPRGILQANARASEILGLTEEQLLGRDSMDPRWRAIHEDGTLWPGETHPAMEVLKTRRPVKNRIMGVHRPDGTLAWVQINALPVGTEEVLVSFSEITERFAVQESLRRSEERYRGLVSVFPDLLYRLSRDGVYLDVVGGASLAPLLPADQMIGRRMQDLLPPHVANPLVATLGAVLEFKEPRTLQITYDRGEGEKDYEIRVSRCAPDECLLVVRDVSERSATDRMKREFIATVSHELRTPLSAIRGALGLLEGRNADAMDPESREMVAIAHRNTERLMRLINDILDLEGLESGRLPLFPCVQPLAPLALEALETLRPLALHYGVEIHTGEMAPGKVRVDAARLIQAIGNLLSNAVKFSPREIPVSLSVKRQEGQLRVEVFNGGAGIPGDFQARVFQKFAQADASDSRTRGGTGLGLNITKTLVERMGGCTGFDSRPGATRFFIVFPEVE